MRKVNLVNHRREFFNVTLAEIKKVVKENYDKTVEFIDVPEGLEIENVTRDNVLNIVDFGRIYFTYDGRGCFLGECPIGEEGGIGFEFTDGEIEITELY